MECQPTVGMNQDGWFAEEAWVEAPSSQRQGLVLDPQVVGPEALGQQVLV